MTECPDIKAITIEEVKTKIVSANDLSLEELQALFSVLLQGISHSSEKNLVQCSDCLGIWFSYIVRKYRQEKNITRICDERRCSDIFMFIIDHMGDGGGPLHNSLSKLLGKVCVYMKHFCRLYNSTIQKWIEIVLELPIYSKNSYFLLELLLKHADSEYILSRRIDIIQKCVFALKHDQLANIASKAYYRCYSFCLDGLVGNGTSPSWQDALYETLTHKDTYINSLLYLAPLFFQKSPKAFVTFVIEKYSWRLSELNVFEVECLLKLCKLGKDLLIIDEPYLGDNPILPLDFVAKTLTHQNEDLRMSAFGLLTSSHKKSRLINKEIYEVLMQKNLLKALFLDSQKLEQRNEFASMLRHFLTRIRDSSHALAKELKNIRQKKGDDPKQLSLSESLKRGQNFLEWFLQFIKQSILPGSTYSQLILSYSVLEILVQLDLDREHRIKDYSNISNKARSRTINNPINFPFKVTIYDQMMIRLIFDNILNNYEDIRRDSVKLLLFCPEKSLQSNEIVYDYKNVLKRSNGFLHELKGKNSEGGALIYDFYSQYFRKTKNEEAYLELITDLIEIILVDTDSSITEKRASLKLHGVYCTLYLLIPQSRKCDADDKLKMVIKKAYDSVNRSCKEAEALVKEFDGEYTKSSDSDYLDVNYAWKVTKEGSRLIYALCCLAGTLLSVDSYKTFLVSSSELIMSQIAIMKHDGTLSALNEIFIKLNEECFSSSHTDISELPLKWLEDSINMVKFKQLLIKRRSGGLPHLITGVLIAATARCKEKDAQKILDRTILELITISRLEYVPNPDEKMDIPQVNALNTLKQIIEYPLLSKKCTHFANDILKLTLGVYHSEAWALRNCASMLFNAFQYLVFGTSREDSLFQQVPSKLFFGRFNGIDQILHLELNYAIAQQHDQQSRLESIFAILNLLLKLKSSNTNDSLAKFYSPLECLLRAKSWKIREAAARTLAKVISFTEAISYADRIITQVETSKGNFNLVHGYLYFFLEILKKVQDSQNKINFGQSVFHYFLENAAHFFSVDCTWTSGKYYIDIFDVLCLTAPPSVNTRSNFDCFMSFLTEESLSRNSDNLNGSKSLFQFTLCKCLLRYLLRFASLNETVKLGCLIIQKSDQDDLIIHVLEFFDLEISFEDMDTEVIQLLRDTVWSLIQKKGSWNHMLSKCLNVLIKLLQSADEAQLETTKEKAEHLLSLCSLRCHLTSCKALRVLCPLIASLNKHCGPENSFAIRYFTQVAEKLGLEDEEAREYLYEALIYFQINLQKEDIYREVSLLYLFNALSDSLENIRFHVSIQLSKSLNSFPITPSFLSLQLAEIIPDMLSSHPLVYRTLAVLKRDRSDFVKKRIHDFLHESPYALFDLELSNLLENTVEKNSCVSRLLFLVSQKKETSEEFHNLIQESLEIELNASILLLKRMSKDGPIGWSRHCYPFTALAETVLDVYILLHNLDHFDKVAIPSELSSLASQRNLHPILMEMMRQPPVYNISG